MSQMNSPSDLQPLRMAVLGMRFGKTIANDLTQAPASQFFQLAGVCDMVRPLADEPAAKHNVKAYYSLDELLEDKSIPVIGLFTGPAGRAKLLQKIIRAGKDVMTTKPFEIDTKEAEAVLREAQKLGRVIHLNSPSPEPAEDLRQIWAWEKEFDLGRRVGIRAEVWASYFMKPDGSWMDNHDLCPGGTMTRLGIYSINDIIRIAGPVEKVNLIASRIRSERPVPDNSLLTMTFPSGCLGAIYASDCIADGSAYSAGLSLGYERGTIYRNVGSARHSAGKSYMTLARQGEKPQERVLTEKTLDSHSGAYQWDIFARAIAKKQSINDDYIRDILGGVRVLEMMRQVIKAAS